MADDPKQLRRKAQKQVRKGNYRRAIDLYEELVELDPKTARHRLKLADLYARQDRTEEALEAYRAVGKIHADDDIYQKAVAVYKQALRLDAEDPNLQVRLAEAYEGLGRLKDAAKTYRTAGEMFEERGERERQVEMLERLCELDHEDVGIRIQLAETYAKVGRKEDALERFDQTADVLEEEGRFDEFIQVAERCLYFDPDDRQMRKRLIRRYLGRGDNKRALKHLQICYNADKTDVETLEMLVEAFDRLDRQSKTALVLRQLAKLHTQLDNREKAISSWRRLLEIDPDNERARQALEQLGAEMQPADQTSEGPPATPEQTTSDGERGATARDDEDRGGQSDDALQDIEFLDESQASSGGNSTAGNRPDDRADEAAASASSSGTSSHNEGPPSAPPTPEQQSGGGDSAVQQLDPSALEPVEDESATPSEASRSELPASSGSGQGDGDGAVEDLTDHVEPVDDSGDAEPAGDPSGGSAGRPGTSSSPNDSALPEERQFDSVEDPDLAERLSEVDVFLKYGLYDKVRELLTGIGPQKARTLPVLERRRKMYEFTEEPEAETGVLLEMARQTDSGQDALRYLSAARQKTDRTQRIDDVADELGLATDDVIDDDRSLPRFESGEMPAVNQSPDDGAAVSGEASDADETAEVEQRPAGAGDAQSTSPKDASNGPLSDDESPTFEQPPSDAGQPVGQMEETGGEGTAEESSPSDEAFVAVEQTEEPSFDADALEEFDGIDEIDEVEGASFDESLETDVDQQAPPTQPSASQADVGAGDSTSNDADDLFNEIDDQFTDDLFDSLVMEESGDEEDVNLGEDDTTGDLAEVDFYIQQGLYDEAEEALEEFEADNPGHEGIDKRRYQIKTARQGAFVRDNPTGAASLSKKFQADVDAEDETPEDLRRTEQGNGPEQPDAMNTNIEVGEAYRDMGMYDEAIEEFREAADDPEVAPHARYRIALCEAERGNAHEAADKLQSLLAESSLPEDVRSAAKSKLDELDGPAA